VEFRQDVFRHIFASKGYALGQLKVMDKEDFPFKFFFQPTPWDVLLDLLGQGTKIYYPIKARHFISWSPKGFIRQNNSIVEVPRAHQEKLSLIIVKVAA
jgi:hypothetical protein